MTEACQREKSPEAAPPEWAVRLLFDAWREVNESIRDSVRLRWDVTKAFLTAMAAILAATVVAYGKLHPLLWLRVTMAVLTFAALFPQIAWQLSYAGFIRRAITKSIELARRIDEIIEAAESKVSVYRVVRHTRPRFVKVILRILQRFRSILPDHLVGEATETPEVPVFSETDVWWGTVGISAVSTLMNLAAAILLLGLFL